MKKIRIILPAIAIVTGISAAFVSQPPQACLGAPQYYYDGSSYLPAGTLGKNYLCESGSSTCTYYGGNGTYLPCQSGIYTPFAVKAKKKQ